MEQTQAPQTPQEPEESGGFGFLYFAWGLVVCLLLCAAASRGCLGPLTGLFTVVPVAAGALALLYLPLKWVFLQCRSKTRPMALRVLLSGFLCAVALSPVVWASLQRGVPSCGEAEMERMVAEGTAYFEAHQEALERQAAAEDKAASFWTISSAHTYGSLDYYPDTLPNAGASGYPMFYPLDAHWALHFEDPTY